MILASPESCAKDVCFFALPQPYHFTQVMPMYHFTFKIINRQWQQALSMNMKQFPIVPKKLYSWNNIISWQQIYVFIISLSKTKFHMHVQHYINLNHNTIFLHIVPLHFFILLYNLHVWHMVHNISIFINQLVIPIFQYLAIMLASFNQA